VTQTADETVTTTATATTTPPERHRAVELAIRAWDRAYLGVKRLKRFRGKRLVRLLLVLSIAGLLSSWFWAESYREPVHPGTEVTLNDAIDLGRAGHIYKATFYDYDSRLVMEGSGGTTWVSYPKSDSETSPLMAAMRQGKTPIYVKKQSLKSSVGFYEQFLLPILVLANLFGLLFMSGRGEGGAREYSEFSKVRAGAGVESSAGASGRRKGVPPVTFANVAGAQTAVVELAEIVDYLKDPTKFERVGALPPKGVLLFGPPGCGKTLLARAVAGEAGVPFYSLSGSEFVESLVGVGAARVRDLFETVRRNAPAIVFIDELDAAGRKRGAGVGGGNDEREQTLNQMLVEMDGFQTQSGVVVIGATNRPDILDPALLRPGRFDRHITVDRPDMTGRFDILRLYGTGRPVANDVDLETLARRTPGFTGAEIANVWNEAALLTVRAGTDEIGMDQLDEAVQRVLAGPKRSGESLTLAERQLVAVHEAGHAVVAAALRDQHAVERVSIARRGRGLGHAALLRDDRDPRPVVVGRTARDGAVHEVEPAERRRDTRDGQRRDRVEVRDQRRDAGRTGGRSDRRRHVHRRPRRHNGHHDVRRRHDVRQRRHQLDAVRERGRSRGATGERRHDPRARLGSPPPERPAHRPRAHDTNGGHDTAAYGRVRGHRRRRARDRRAVAAHHRAPDPRPREVPRRQHRLRRPLPRRDVDGLRVPQGGARGARREPARHVSDAGTERPALPLGRRAHGRAGPRRADGAHPRRLAHGRPEVPRQRTSRVKRWTSTSSTSAARSRPGGSARTTRRCSSSRTACRTPARGRRRSGAAPIARTSTPSRASPSSTATA
jgi:cell division protease FtsH